MRGLSSKVWSSTGLLSWCGEVGGPWASEVRLGEKCTSYSTCSCSTKIIYPQPSVHEEVLMLSSSVFSHLSQTAALATAAMQTFGCITEVYFSQRETLSPCCTPVFHQHSVCPCQTVSCGSPAVLGQTERCHHFTGGELTSGEAVFLAPICTEAVTELQIETKSPEP